MEEIVFANFSVAYNRNGSVTILDHATGARLDYNAEEWSAFVKGLEAGEFEVDTAAGQHLPPSA